MSAVRFLALAMVGCAPVREIHPGGPSFAGVQPAETITVTDAEAARIDAVRAQEDLVVGDVGKCEILREAARREQLAGARTYFVRRARWLCPAADKQRAEAEAAARDRAAREANDARIAEEEQRTGHCVAKNRDALEAWLSSVRAAMKTKTVASEDPGQYDLLSHELLAIRGAPVELLVRDPQGGELHVFAFAPRPVGLDVFDAAGDPIGRRSPVEATLDWRHRGDGTALVGFAGDPPRPAHRDSRVAQVNAGGSLQLHVHGEGCVLIFAFRRS
jgi:hypothetical protein